MSLTYIITQMQYGIVVAIISVVSYVVSGWTEMVALGLGVGVVLLVGFIVAAKRYYRIKE